MDKIIFFIIIIALLIIIRLIEWRTSLEKRRMLIELDKKLTKKEAKEDGTKN